MDIPYRRKIFLNTGTWVECTISNGDIAQVLFLSKRSINGDHKGMRMKLSDQFRKFFQVQGMYRIGESSVHKNTGTFVRMEQMSDIWA